MSRLLQTAVLVAILVIGGIFVATTAYSATPATDHTKVENESVTIDFGNWTQLDETDGDVYYDNETAWNSSDERLYAEDNDKDNPDYKYNPDNQSLYWYDTKNTTDGATAEVTYHYASRPAMASGMASAMGGVFVLAGVGILVIMGYALLDSVGFLGGGRV